VNSSKYIYLSEHNGNVSPKGHKYTATHTHTHTHTRAH